MSDQRRRGACKQVWPLRLPNGSGPSARIWLAGEPQECRAALRVSGPRGFEKAVKTKPPVAERGLATQAEAGAQGPHLVLRLRTGPDARRTAAEDLNADRRVHAGVPGTARRNTADVGAIPAGLGRLFVYRGVPEHVRSVSELELTASRVRVWMGKVARGHSSSLWGRRGRTARANPPKGSRATVTGRTGFLHVAGSQCPDKAVAWHHNYVRPNSSLGFRPTAPEALVPGGPRTYIDAGAAFGSRSRPGCRDLWLRCVEALKVQRRTVKRMPGRSHSRCGWGCSCWKPYLRAEKDRVSVVLKVFSLVRSERTC